MSEETLRNAMRAGSTNPRDERAPTDLGRFGLGLKTASFSQARSLTVVSRVSRSSPASTRRWDLDHVVETNRWALLKTAPEEAGEIAPLKGSGTVVHWSKLDRIVDDRPTSDTRARRAFFAVVDAVKSHCELVFHRLMSQDKIAITVNGRDCIAWDPFLRDHPDTERLQEEQISLQAPDRSTQIVTIRPFVLPHRSRLSEKQREYAAGPRGWNLQQGYYLYRARRLIVAGDWFDPDMKPEEHYKLARIEVDITQEMDAQWNLDVRKSRARPPAALKDDFVRIARATRSKAQEVYRHRGKRELGQSQKEPVMPVWYVDASDERVEYTINRRHAVVAHLLKSLGGVQLKLTRGVLNLIERNLPVAHIVGLGFSDEDRLPLGTAAVGEDLVAAIKDVYRDLLTRGHTDESARQQLLATQPFDRYPEVIEAIEREDQG